jgi:hypothetical protein
MVREEEGLSNRGLRLLPYFLPYSNTYTPSNHELTAPIIEQKSEQHVFE